MRSLLAAQHVGIGVPRPRERPAPRAETVVSSIMAVTRTRRRRCSSSSSRSGASRRRSPSRTTARTSSSSATSRASSTSGASPVDGGWPDQLTPFTDETVRGVASRRGTARSLLVRRSRRRRVPSALLLDRRRRLARADDRRAAGAALRRRLPRGRRTGRSSPTRPTRARPPTWRSGSATSTRARREPSSARACTPFPAAGRRTARSCSRSSSATTATRSIYLVDVESGEARELTPHEGDGALLPGPVGAPTAPASTCSPTRAASSAASRSTTSRPAVRVGRGSPRRDVEELAVLRRRPRVSRGS